jgi:hypothetical protein
MVPSSRSGTIPLADPLKRAAIAACASLIHALITPFFNDMFGDDEIIFHREVLKSIVSLSISLPLIQYATASKVELLAQEFCQIIFVSSAVSSIRAGFDIGNFLAPNPLFHAGAINMLRSWGLYAEAGTNSTYVYWPIINIGT